jgi:hypothetical protein
VTASGGAPSDVWVWSGPSKTFERVVSNVTSVAVRIPHGHFEELPADIEQAAPG